MPDDAKRKKLEKELLLEKTKPGIYIRENPDYEKIRYITLSAQAIVYPTSTQAPDI